MSSNDPEVCDVILTTEKCSPLTSEGKKNPISERRIVKYRTTSRTRKTTPTTAFSEVKLKHDGLYGIINCHPKASDEELKRAYKKTMLKLHPDKNPHARDKEDLNERFNEAVNAYKILSDKKKRKIYDKYGIDAVRIQEESNCPKSMLWFLFSRAGRICGAIIMASTCCFMCFCCCKCFCNCFCNNCCNNCCKKEESDDDGYMNVPPPEEPHQETSQAALLALLNSLSIKKTKAATAAREAPRDSTSSPTDTT